MPVNLLDAVLKVLLLWILTAPHEFAHAWVATRLGDDTPRREGRVTLNPLAHIDWIGTALLPFIMSLMGLGFIGWGKPVRSEPSKLRGGMNGLLLVALAGPASNIVMAVILGGLAGAFQGGTLGHYIAYGVDLSLFLAVFNLLPIPPLDGSHVLRNMLPYGAAQQYDRMNIWISYLLMITVGSFLLRLLLWPTLNLIYKALLSL